jgi:hypothetical protein
MDREGGVNRVHMAAELVTIDPGLTQRGPEFLRETQRAHGALGISHIEKAGLPPAVMKEATLPRVIERIARGR